MSDDAIRKYEIDNNAMFLNILGEYVPAWYNSVNDEYVSAKESCAFIHRKDLKQIFISGENRNRLLDLISTADLSKMEYYTFCKSAVCDEDANIIDILWIYVFGDGIFIICNFFKYKDILDILGREKGDMNCEIMDITQKSNIYTFVGPDTLKFIGQILDSDVNSLNVGEFSVEPFNESEIIISRSDYYGKYTYEFIVENESVKALLDILTKLKQEGETRVNPMGYMAHNILRLEKGLPSLINELNNKNLIEARMEGIIHFDKNSFIGKKALLNIKEKGIRNSLFLSSFDTKNTIIKNTPIYDANSVKIGYITSSAYSPYLMKTIAMGFIINSQNYENNEIYLKIDAKLNKTISGKIISPITN